MIIYRKRIYFCSGTHNPQIKCEKDSTRALSITLHPKYFRNINFASARQDDSHSQKNIICSGFKPFNARLSKVPSPFSFLFIFLFFSFHAPIQSQSVATFHFIHPLLQAPFVCSQHHLRQRRSSSGGAPNIAPWVWWRKFLVVNG